MQLTCELGVPVAAVLSNGRQKDDTKEHVQKESPLTSCVLEGILILFPGRLPGPILILKIHFRSCKRRVILKTVYL